MKVELFEHSGAYVHSLLPDNLTTLVPSGSIRSKYFRNKIAKGPCFSVSIEDDTKIKINANYYIGVDWLIAGQRYVYVAPKIDKKAVSNLIDAIAEEDVDETETLPQTGQEALNLDYLSMLSQCMYH